MYTEGEGGRAFFIHFQPPLPLKQHLLYDFFRKIKRLPKEVGGRPNIFSVFGFKSLFRKRWGGVSYIDLARPWIFDAHGVFLGKLTK